MISEIELRHLRYFLAVAETLDFSEAAERLGLATGSSTAPHAAF